MAATHGHPLPHRRIAHVSTPARSVRSNRTHVAQLSEGATTNQPGATPRENMAHKPISPERAEHDLIPHIPFIKFNAMPFEQCAQLVLKTHLAMMVFLSLDVSLHGFDIGLAD